MYLVQGSEAIGIGYVWVNTFLQQLSDCMEERTGEERRGEERERKRRGEERERRGGEERREEERRGEEEERRGEERERERGKLLCWWVYLAGHTSRCNT